MNYKFFSILILVSSIMSCNQPTTKNQQENPTMKEATIQSIKSILTEQPPTCKIVPHEMTIHNDTRVDNYFWLKEREDKNVIDYLNQENAYTKAVMSPTEQLQKDLFAEMKARIKEDDESVPFFQNGFYYKSKYETGGEYPIYVRSKSSDFSDEEVLFDCNEMAKGKDYFDLATFEVSPNNELIAYATDIVSRRMYNIQIKNLKTGEVYPEVIKNNDGGFAWANDNKTLFYSIQNEETLRSEEVKKHTLGTTVANDPSVYFETDEMFDCYVYRSKSGRYIIVGSSSTLTDEYRILDTDTPNGDFKLFQERIKGMEYDISHYQDMFFIKTNKDEAQNFKLMTCDASNTSVENWKEFIPHRKETMIENYLIFKNHIVISERTDGLVHLRIMNQTTKEDYYIPFNDETYVVYTTANYNFDTQELRFWYTSLTTPGTTYLFDMNTKEEEVLKQQEVLGDFDANDYESKRIFATARDGVKIPISIVYKKGTPLDGTAPLLQYAYGSYGSSTSPTFSLTRLSLLDRGFIYAIAHIRGGEELGRQWYEDGKMMKKWNTFNDFIDCSKYLLQEKYTNTDKLFAMGGSAGGLLMGVVANEASELYKGILAAVPFVDVMTTMLDASIPLTTGEYEEWGNPNEKEAYDYMLSYSPYDQVKSQYYTNILVTTGLHDSQVQYWEPAKWVAKLRTMKTDANLVLLQTNMAAGHGGASGRFEYLKEIALEDAFMLMLLE